MLMRSTLIALSTFAALKIFEAAGYGRLGAEVLSPTLVLVAYFWVADYRTMRRRHKEEAAKRRGSALDSVHQ